MESSARKLMHVDNFQDNLIVKLEQFIPRLKLQPNSSFSNRIGKTKKENDNTLCLFKILNCQQSIVKW